MNLIQILNTDNWHTINVNYDEIQEIASSLSRKPALYQIQTDTPINIFHQIHTRSNDKYYKISEKIINSFSLEDDFKILPINDGDMYTVYSGHTSLLRQRFNEHFKGSRGTGCLAIYEEVILRDFNWSFTYIDLESTENYTDSELVRTFLEQRHRANIGWPILCSQ